MDKKFLTYNQQMRYLRDNKKIQCTGTADKTLLCRHGYFNLVNGYKMPFVTGTDIHGNYVYYPSTSLQQIFSVKQFDDTLRLFLLKHITKIEEEVRTFAAYKFDEINQRGAIPWYQVEAYNTSSSENIPKIISLISKAYSEINRSKAEYVRFYFEHHKMLPTWILLKAISFSTFIDFIDYGKTEIKTALCQLYSLTTVDDYADYKLLIGSLHWLRKIRNACAHNERIYSIHRNSGRIRNTFLSLLPPQYATERMQNLLDLIMYCGFYLNTTDYASFIHELQQQLEDLRLTIIGNAYDNIRNTMGLHDAGHLELLLQAPKNILYHHF